MTAVLDLAARRRAVLEQRIAQAERRLRLVGDMETDCAEIRSLAEGMDSEVAQFAVAFAEGLEADCLGLRAAALAELRTVLALWDHARMLAHFHDHGVVRHERNTTARASSSETAPGTAADTQS